MQSHQLVSEQQAAAITVMISVLLTTTSESGITVIPTSQIQRLRLRAFKLLIEVIQLARVEVHIQNHT